MAIFKQIVYPYTWVESKEFNLYSQGPYPIVYTLSFTDPYVYVKNTSTTYVYTEKQKFESYERKIIDSLDFEPLNQAGTQKLNETLKIFSIKGRVVYNDNPIVGAVISSTLGASSSTQQNLSSVTSDSLGNFTLTGEYLPGQDFFNLIITADKFSTYTTYPFDSNENIISDLGVIVLSPLVIGYEENFVKDSSLSQTAIDQIVASKTTFETLQQEKLIDLLNTLKYTLLPLVLKQFFEFGVVNIQEALDKKLNIKPNCPDQAKLTEIINKKNKLVKQLDNAYKIISRVTQVVNGIQILVSSLQTLKSTSLAVPYPLPPAASNTLDETDKKIKKYKAILDSFTLLLNITSFTLKEIIDYLNLLDQYIQECYPDAQQDQISTELIALTIQQTTQTSPIISDYNGFKLSVETEPTTNSLKRRRAIAQNKQNVVMLKGEWSFSSIDQILIDELVFYIQQNNLKAD
jgi:hypothetical protein